MNNQRPLGPKDEQAKLDYDVGFTGVDERTHVMELNPGFMASAMNCRFRDGKCKTRLGAKILPWMKGSGLTPFTSVYGAAKFSDPNGVEWMIIAADGGVWRTRPNQVATPVRLPAGVTLGAGTFAQFVQCFNVLVLLRGPDYASLVMTDLDAGFQPVVLSAQAVASDESPMPNSPFGIFFSNRLLLVEGKDLCAVSQTLDYTGYVPPTETFRINQGEADSLVAMAAFGPGNILMFKTGSVYQVQNATGDFSSATLTPLTDEYGCGAPLSVCVQGTTAYWVDGEGRVASAQLTSLNQTQSTDQRLTDLLPNTLARINTPYIGGMVAAVWDGKLYVAAPLDDATTNSGVMVYDFQTAAWCGTDEGPALCVKAFVKMKVNGKVRLLFVGTDGCIRLYEEGFQDEVLQQVPTRYFDVLVNTLPTPGNGFQVVTPGATAILAVNSATNNGTQWGCDNLADAQENFWLGFQSGAWVCPGVTPSQINGGVRFSYAGNAGFTVASTGSWAYVDAHTGVEVTQSPITTSWTSRGYVTRQYIFANDDRKRFLMLAALMNTWAPDYTLNVIVNGANQSTGYVENQTRSNTAYDVFGQADWDPSNVNDDHATPKREDYSVALPDATGFNLGDNGVDFELHQTITDRKPIDEKGHWVQLQAQNTSGRVELVGVFMEAQEGEKLSGPVI